MPQSPTYQVSIRFNATEMQAIEAYASKHGLSAYAAVKQLVNAALTPGRKS